MLAVLFIKEYSMKEKIYQVAIDTHKFYDEVSMKLVAGIITITGAAFFINEKTKLSEGTDTILFVVVALITLGLLVKYRNCAYYANVARNVAAHNEISEELIGVSQALGNKELYPQMHKPKKIRLNIHGAVHFLWFVCFSGLFFAAYTVS
jgi:hypothetical protein